MSKKKPSFDVAPNGDKWKVKQHGNSKASKNFDKQSDAIDYGKKRAKQDKTELYIKNRKGQVRDANSYGKDPYPPKG
jgi:hypothetical protein